MAESTDRQAPYATSIGLIYVFNLIIGTGALALPRAFSDAGWLLGLALLVVSCMISYINATFVIECMSSANAMMMGRRLANIKKLAVQMQNDDSDMLIDETTPMLQTSGSNPSLTSFQPKAEYFEIVHRTELSEIARLFLGRIGNIVFFAILALYLFGDLAIYAAVVPKSLLNVICSINSTHCSFNNTTIDESQPCRSDWLLSRMTVYRICVAIFILVCGPFVYVGMTKTKYLQMMTTLARWLAFLLMITMAVRRLAVGEGTGNPGMMHPIKFAHLFGISVYAFMCHHSLPAVVTPMRNKSRIYMQLFLVYVLILLFYTLLSMTGAFAFANVQDVYTLQFLNLCDPRPLHFYQYIIDYFLVLFPVFTISMNFPIVGVTLCNNLRSLLAWDDIDLTKRPNSTSAETSIVEYEETASTSQSDTVAYTVPTKMMWFKSRILLPTLVLVFPFCIALITDDIESLASIVGSYAGVGVQFIIPSMLVLSSRRKMYDWFNTSVPKPHASPFQRQCWIIFMFTWAVFTIIVVTLNYIFFRMTTVVTLN